MHAVDVLGPSGLLAWRSTSYESRPAQLAMAERVEATIRAGGAALVEAGTGTGKSYAYLIPAILSGKRTIVSTANKTLQAQLIAKDLPALAELLEGPLNRTITYALAKGRANYLCLVAAARGETPADLEGWMLDALNSARAFGPSRGRHTGDIEEAPRTLTPEERKALTADEETCLRRRCPLRAECCYYRAVAEREQADIVVTNHALLSLQLYLEAEMLPAADVLVIDEAHQLERYMISVASVELAPTAFHGLPQAAQRLVPAFLAALLERAPGGGGDAHYALPARFTYPEGAALASELTRAADAEAEQSPDSLHERRLRSVARRVRALSEPTPDGYLRHVERRGERVTASLTAIDVSELLARAGERYQAVIYTSATLSTAGSFRYARTRLGVDPEASELALPSPFDLSTQARLYLPLERAMPSPKADRAGFDRAVREELAALINASGGGCLALFTSYRSMTEAADVLRWVLPYGYRVRAQGEAPRGQLLDWLRETPGATLCATASFWEGVDVPGAALRLVVIDKLPFGDPSDPVERARQDRVGKASFMELCIPEATLRLLQGFGRLIRRQDDYGVVAIMDPRLWQAPWARRVRAALPPAQLVTSIAAVEAFYRSIRQGPSALAAAHSGSAVCFGKGLRP